MLHQLKRPSSDKKKSMQIGRWNGSGKGNYSTKGLKWQKARSGFSQQPGFEWGQTPLHMRLPKLRWFKKFFKHITKIVPINLATLEADDRIVDVVSGEVLYALGYGKSGHSFKILGNGEIKKSLTIEGITTSVSAQQAIEKAWGSVTA